MQEPTSEELTWVGIDFDKTIADNTGHPKYEVTDVIKGAKEFVDKIWARGYKPVVYTARPWQQHATIQAWLKENNIRVYSIIGGKPLFRAMIDDKAIHFNGSNWEEVLNHKLLK